MLSKMCDKYSQRPPSQEFVTLFLWEKKKFGQDPPPTLLANVTKYKGFSFKPSLMGDSIG